MCSFDTRIAKSIMIYSIYSCKKTAIQIRVVMFLYIQKMEGGRDSTPTENPIVLPSRQLRVRGQR